MWRRRLNRSNDGEERESYRFEGGAAALEELFLGAKVTASSSENRVGSK
jgi:hypothetical protein